MTKLYGMTIKQLKDTLEEMKTVYPYKDETTKMSDLQALDPRNRWAVEIITTDEPTGIRVVLSKSIEAESEEW
jgi:hypothetical protein